MKINIRNFWNTEIQGPVQSPVHVPLEEVLKNIGFITICEITIDGQRKGSVDWNGKKLSICKPSKESFP